MKDLDQNHIKGRITQLEQWMSETEPTMKALLELARKRELVRDEISELRARLLASPKELHQP
jgi:hypothetical protein